MTVSLQNGEIAIYNTVESVSRDINRPIPQSRKGDSLIYRYILSLPIMGLFVEWLYPLSDGSLSASLIDVLYVLTALLLFVGVFHLKMWVSIPLHLIITLGAWVFLFGRGREIEWLISYVQTLQYDASVLVQEWSLSAMGSETRTLILMMGWSLLVATVQSLALYRGSIGLFTAATLIYLLCLETLLGLEVYPDIVRTALLIIILHGGITLSRLIERSTSSDGISKRHYNLWFVMVCVIAIVVVGSAWVGGRVISAKPAQQFSVESAVEKLKDWSGVESHKQNSNLATTGYGAGDGDLGAPLQLDSKIVFTAESPIPSYWRGETFGYYDGRRWAEPQAYFQAVPMEGNLQNESIIKKDDGQSAVVQTVSFVDPMSDEFPLFSGGDINNVMSITTVNEKKMVYLLQDEIADTIKYPATSSSSPVKGYQINVRNPSLNKQLMRANSSGDPEVITKRYLQLPEQLPQRVKEFGVQLITNTTNRYDAVQAVEHFLQNNYKYSLRTSVPPANQDFVDNFLFETKIGYCNHFATSMVILLRTQGIPSRLVKGYAPGTLEDASDTTYVVKSSDAHAWVEVYFPNIGWIPFDPTPGFSTNLQESSEVMAIPKQDGEIKDTLWGLITHRLDQIVTMALNVRIAVVEAGYFIPILIIVLILLGAMLLSIWRSRRHLHLWRLRYITRSAFPQKEQLLQAAIVIWDEVGRRFGPIPNGITVREYVHTLKITDENLRDDLIQFVQQWESIAYNETALNRVHSISFLHRCALLAHALS